MTLKLNSRHGVTIISVLHARTEWHLIEVIALEYMAKAKVEAHPFQITPLRIPTDADIQHVAQKAASPASWVYQTTADKRSVFVG